MVLSGEPRGIRAVDWSETTARPRAALLTVPLLSALSILFSLSLDIGTRIPQNGHPDRERRLEIGPYVHSMAALLSARTGGDPVNATRPSWRAHSAPVTWPEINTMSG
jgi:hypothetical protein